MKVRGYEITEDLQERCWVGLRQSFRARDLEALLAAEGLPNEPRWASAAYQAASKLVQRWRTAGVISYADKRWTKRRHEP
jgi:hypothetical protein